MHQPETYITATSASSQNCYSVTFSNSKNCFKRSVTSGVHVSKPVKQMCDAFAVISDLKQEGKRVAYTRI